MRPVRSCRSRTDVLIHYFSTSDIENKTTEDIREELEQKGIRDMTDEGIYEILTIMEEMENDEDDEDWEEEGEDETDEEEYNEIDLVPEGLDPDIVCSFPTFHPDTFLTLCPICKETSNNNSPWKQLSCNHVYHQECIDSFFQYDTRCPICRRDFESDL